MKFTGETAKKLLYYSSLGSALLSLVLLAYFSVSGVSLYLYTFLVLLLFFSLVAEMLVKEGSYGVLFLAYGLGVGYLFELIGLRIGLPFGRYKYSRVLLLPGGVFAFTPAFWYMFCYSSHRVSTAFKGPGRIVYSVFLSLGLDLIVDPAISTLFGIRVWSNMGLHFGVPLSSFVGWILVSTIIILLYHRLGREKGDVTIPIIVYSGVSIIFIVIAFKLKAYIMSLFGVGVYLTAMAPLIIERLNNFILEKT